MSRFLIPILAACTLLLGPLAYGETVNTAPPYIPDLGDLMSSTQLRHFKLWYAGSSRNWDVARFEISKIRKSFATATRYYPEFGGVRLEDLIRVQSYTPLDNLEAAVAKRDVAAFDSSFNKLTDACNGCHQQAHVGFIRIRVPTSSPFSNLMAFAERLIPWNQMDADRSRVRQIDLAKRGSGGCLNAFRTVEANVSHDVFFYVRVRAGLSARQGKRLGAVATVERSNLGLVRDAHPNRVCRTSTKNDGPEHY